MKIDLENGKYTYYFVDGQQWILRYGESWLTPSDCAGNNILLAMAHRIEELENAQQTPVLYQMRFRPTWDDKHPWTGWEDCSKENFEDCKRVPLLHDWEWEARALYDTPQPKISSEYVERAEKYITEICINAVEKLEELAPDRGWDPGESTAEMYIRRLREIQSNED